MVEILSHANRPAEMERKLEFYERHGVEEYYIYDPTHAHQSFVGYLRRGGRLEPIAEANRGWTSPRLGVFMYLGDDGRLELSDPDGEPFQSFDDLRDAIEEQRTRTDLLVLEVLHEQGRVAAERHKVKTAKAEAGRQRRKAEIAAKQAEAERMRADDADARAELADAKAEVADTKAEVADAKAEVADAKAEVERLRAEVAVARAERLAAQLPGAGDRPPRRDRPLAIRSRAHPLGRRRPIRRVRLARTASDLLVRRAMLRWPPRRTTRRPARKWTPSARGSSSSNG